MRKGFCLSVAALLAGLSLAAFTAGADGADAVANVTGGGQAMFDDPRFEEMGTPTTTFGMGVTILSDGSAKGHFECLINGVLALSVMPVDGTLNNDGSATFSGPGIVHFAGGDTFFCDCFTVTATAGGRGVGTFCLGPPTFPDTDCDHETVTDGNIAIHVK
ncbi:MAG TPA: hypothetical protein VKI65_12400 [Gemmataceae bacterium]|nr:hypothetical protein [Gemmataceae bacterium]